MSEPINWDNRIVAYGEKPADQFLANPSNWRQHPPAQRQALQTSLRKVGWIGVVVENVQTGHLIDGHERIWQALQNNNAPVPFIQVNLTPEEEDFALATYDPITNMAQTDREMLAALLDSVRDTPLAEDQDVRALLNQVAGDNHIRPTEQAAPEAQIDRAEELREKWQTERGQVWEVPSKTVPGKSHRVMCGDNTSAEDVARLMSGEKAQGLIADPPYGMNLDTDYTKMPRAIVKNRRYSPVSGDSVDFDFSSFRHLDCDEQLWWGADYYCQQLPPGGSWFVWDKRIESNDSAFGSGFELCWSKKKHKRRLLRFLWSGLTAHDPNQKRFHPTQKPVALYVELISLILDVGHIVYDPFSGSGVTLIAAEQSSRLCYGMEIEPKYVAVTLERLSNMGLVPELHMLNGI